MKFRNCKLNNEEKLREAIKNSINFGDVLNKMGYVTHSGLYKTLYNYIDKFNIDVKHLKEFKTQRRERGEISLNSILNNKIEFYNNHDLKLKLYKAGLKKPICEKCGQNEYWHGEKISLILDHVNGNNKDNRIENLRIICPNCDAALPTFKGKNRKNKRNKEKNLISVFKRNKEEKIEKIKEQIINSGIDFTKKGWSKKLGNVLNINATNARKWLIKLFPEIWESCFKHKK